MRTMLLLCLLAGCLDAPTSVEITGVAIADPTCEVAELGCTVIAERDTIVVLPVPTKPSPMVELYIHSDSTALAAEGWRVAGVAVDTVRASTDAEGADVALEVPRELLAGPIAIESDTSAPYEIEVLSRVAGPNQTVPSGCTCSATLHKIYCQVWGGQTYTYCSNCCGY